ncbi:MAG: TolC family protein [Verrucomicrobia bacterium]|nr:TolC family protein [Verrucomicrobiota bacterium]
MNTLLVRWCRHRSLAVAGALILATPGRSAQSTPAGEALPRPLTLGAALAYAQEHNPRLERVRELVEQREGGQLEAAARRRLKVGVGAAYAYTDPHLEEMIPGFDGVPLPQQDSWDAHVSVRQTLYSGGGIEAGIAGAREQTEAARVTVAAAESDLRLAVTRTFCDVLLARHQIEVEAEAIGVLEGELAQARVRRQAGAGSDFEVLRAEVALANARPALVRARNAYRTRQDQLRTVLGADTPAPGGDLGVEGDLARTEATGTLEDELRAARDRRPELVAQDHVIAAAETEVTAAKAGTRPQVNLVAGYLTRKATYSSGFADTLSGLTAGVQADWSLFDGQATAGKVRQAWAKVRQATARRTELRQQIDLEVRRSMTAVDEARELMGSAEQVINEAQESLRLAQTRLNAGTATQLDVLSAQVALTEARTNLVQAQHDYAVALAELHHATGSDAPVR